MTNIIFIYSTSGDIFQEIEYTSINELSHKLKLLIIHHDSNMYIQLLINKNNLNNFNNINTLLLSKLTNDDFITILFLEKNTLYYLNNEYKNSISIYFISGVIFQNIQYNDFDELKEKLEYLIIHYDSDIYIQLLINESNLNNFDIIDMLILLTLNEYNHITIVFIQKKDWYCLGNENGKYILDYKYDNYSKLCNLIIFNNNNSYNIIKNTSYKNLILLAINQDGYALKYASINLKNDKEFVLECVKQDGRSLKFASINLQNDKEIVLRAVKKDGLSLKYASINLRNNKEIVLKAIKQNKYAFNFASIDLQDDKQFISIIIKQNNNLNLKN